MLYASFVVSLCQCPLCMRYLLCILSTLQLLRAHVTMFCKFVYITYHLYLSINSITAIDALCLTVLLLRVMSVRQSAGMHCFANLVACGI